ncbi:Imm9 family immunity protein [Cephaloticoccus capnophilus]|uniref:Imm9 family immunity protein n=1 Tax=Cephaloticoccus capnophilus TaxID=1548208 RepID=UPI0009EE88D6|nr:Imm9 family immunity protein [Cephaloticoccus capnophilus]
MKDKKVKQVRATMPTSVPGIWNFANMGPIERKVNTYIDSILPRINIEDLSGWRLLLHINSVCSDLIGVYKKFLRYPSDREYVILLTIPIPDNTQAPYGMPPGRDGTIGYFRSIKDRGKQSHLLEPEYDKYDGLNQYILAAAIRAIDLGFTKGFTCYGKKIKFQDL